MSLQGNPNHRIVHSAYRLLRGELKGEPTAGGLCLAMVRVVIEDAFYQGRFLWYQQFRTSIVDPKARASSDPYARDMEKSLRQDFGMNLILPRIDYVNPQTSERDAGRYVNLGSIDTRYALEPGDLLFRWDTTLDRPGGVFVGHVAILMPGELVLENVTNRAGSLQRGPTTLSRLGAWPITTVVRFDPERA